MPKNKSDNNWFKEWFDSPYYHILYKNRNDKEAQGFIDNLITYLQPPKESKVLDVACGKGRHAIYMNQLGYDVDAFDLSKNSIDHAKQMENTSLHFFVNDIRQPLKLDAYDYAFNLFTSFGYFDDENDNYESIKAISRSLKENGRFIIDFMNVSKVIKNMVNSEVKVVDNIRFNIIRSIKDGFIIKDISFTDNGIDYNFSEKVKAIYKNDFNNYFNRANLKVVATFGDYNLAPYDENTSDRLILITEKI